MIDDDAFRPLYTSGRQDRHDELWPTHRKKARNRRRRRARRARKAATE